MSTHQTKDFSYLSVLSKADLVLEQSSGQVQFKTCSQALQTTILSVKSVTVFCTRHAVCDERILRMGQSLIGDYLFFEKEALRLRDLLRKIEEETKKKEQDVALKAVGKKIVQKK